MSAQAPAPTLSACGAPIDLRRPLLMGIVNASPDSFSDGGLHADLPARVRLGRELIGAGAHILDVGGESASTGRAPVPVAQEIELVAPLVARLCSELGAMVSVDTYKPEVAAAAIEAGARIVNDVSGLRDPELADVCAATGAALVVMHTRAAPRERLQDPGLYGTLDEELGHYRRYSEAELRAKMEAAGLTVEQVLHFNRITRPGWWFTGRVLKRRSSSRVLLWFFDRLVWLWRRIDRTLPWPAVSVIGIGRKRES